MNQTTKICQQCGEPYPPKSNNSKYCGRKCNNKASGIRRTERRHTDEEYRKDIHKKESQRFKKNYHNKPGYKEKHHQEVRKWRATPTGRKKTNQSALNFYYKNHEENKIKNRMHNKELYNKNPEAFHNSHKKYMKTKQGKLANKRHGDKRGRELKSIELFIDPFPEETPVDYHHINNILVIPLPKKTHQYVPGINKEQHLKFNAQMIKKLFCLDIKELLSIN